MAVFSRAPTYRNHLNRLRLGAALSLMLAVPAAAADYPAELQLSSLSIGDGFKISGVAAGDYSGSTIDFIGDFNGDGFDDIVIGAWGVDGKGGSYTGGAYVVFGKASGFTSNLELSTLNGSNGFKIAAEAKDDFLGFPVAKAGDVNGDGLADLLVAAEDADPHGASSGKGYVIFGSRTPQATVFNLSTLDGKTGFEIRGARAGDILGYWSGPAGDINNDGFGDIVVGSTRHDKVGGVDSREGAAYVIFGKGKAFPANLDVSSLNGANGFKIEGAAAGDGLGQSAGPAGDFNGDGIDDLLVGAANIGPSATGGAYLVYGKTSAFSSTLKLSSLSVSNGFKIFGPAANSNAAISVDAIGDFNGDGRDDIMVGAKGVNSSKGAGYIVYGTASTFPTGLQLSAISSSSGVVLNGAANNDAAGKWVSGLADVNADGFADVIASGKDTQPVGTAYVVFGGPSVAMANVESLDGTTGFKIRGETAGDFFSEYLHGKGDFNGDGFADVLATAYFADTPATDAGVSYLIFGKGPSTGVTRNGSDANQMISGGAQADTLNGVNGDDILEGRGGGDTLSGGAGNNTASYAHAPAGVVADLASPGSNTGDAAGDIYSNISNLLGSGLADTLVGDGNPNRLTGGRGKDIQTGGLGYDTFVYRDRRDSPAGAGRDVITDFYAATGGSTADVINLSAVDAKDKVWGNQRFKFIGTKAFTGPGQLRLKQTSGGLIIQGNTGGTLKADFEILLQGFANTGGKLTARDFKL